VNVKRGLAVFLACLSVIILFAGNRYAQADDGALFSVLPILPPGNIGGEEYHVKAEPGEAITLQAMLSNHTARTLEIDITALNAYSGPEGIFYQSPGEVDSDTYAIADSRAGLARYIDAVDTILLVAGMSAVLSVEVTVPEMGAGTVLGGIRVAAKDRMREAPVRSVDLTIRIDLPDAAEPSVVLGDLIIEGSTVRIPVVNRSAAIARGVSAAYEIRDEHGKAVLKGMIALPEMAPMSEYRKTLPSKSLKDGAYTLHMQVSTAADFVLPFTVGDAPEPPPQETQPPPQETQPPPQETQQPVKQETEQPRQTAEAEPAPDNPATSHASTPMGRVIVCFVVFGIPAAFAGIVIWMAVRQKRAKPRGRHRARPRAGIFEGGPAQAL
jgi:hypothetical protein